MHPRKKIGADTIWNCDEMPPAELIKSLHLESATIDQHEFSRAEWFWRSLTTLL